MTTLEQTGLRGLAWALLTAMTLLGAPGRAGAAGATLGVAAGYAVPARPGFAAGYLAPYSWYYPSGACLRAGGCAAWAWNDRYLPRRPLAPDEPVPVELDIWGSAGSPWGYVRRLPPPTPESHIQPQYKHASTVRPEFEQASSSAAPR